MTRDEDTPGSTSLLNPAANVFGGLGLIPFFAPLLAPLLTHRGDLVLAADLAQRAYAGVILAFLGGARFGRALEGRDGGVIALSMIPPLAAFAALLPLPLSGAAVRGVLGAGLLLQWAWDQATPSLPKGYRTLRAVLSLGAVTSLVLGGFLFS